MRSGRLRVGYDSVTFERNLVQPFYEDLTPDPIELPPRQGDVGYVRPPLTDQTFVPEVY